MYRNAHRHCLIILLVATLAACGSTNRQLDIQNMYELPSAARPGAVDNDSYYRQPNTYNGCAVINDAPSCGGG